MEEIQTLAWDSGFFGFKVARIVPATLEYGRLEQVLTAARSQNVSLAYWNIAADDLPSRKAAESLHGALVEEKVIYAATLDIQVIPVPSAGAAIEEYTEPMPTPAMESLALQSGVYSRFKMDKKISSEQFTRLYIAWIRESTAKRFAEAVLVARSQDGRIAGLLTLGRKNGRGSIGLLAVDGDKRGQGFGRALVLAAHNWYLRNGLPVSQVATQRNNIPAARLYERCNYSVEKLEKVFHFWL